MQTNMGVPDRAANFSRSIVPHREIRSYCYCAGAIAAIEKATQNMERVPIEARHAHKSYVLGLCTGLLRGAMIPQELYSAIVQQLQEQANTDHPSDDASRS
jgi:methyl coenzyme M reductase subunit C